MISTSEVLLSHEVIVLLKPMLSKLKYPSMNLHEFGHMIHECVNVRCHTCGMVDSNKSSSPFSCSLLKFFHNFNIELFWASREKFIKRYQFAPEMLNLDSILIVFLAKKITNSDVLEDFKLFRAC